MAAKDEDIGGVAERASKAVSANKLEVVEGYPGKEKGKGAVNQIQPPTDGGVIKNPKAHAYAAAKQAAFSSVGRVITPGKDGNNRFQGRYQMGWAKGMTPDQANQAFDTKFANVDPRIQEKYAKIGDPASKLAPSEKAAQLKQQRDEEAKKNPIAKPVPGADFEKLTEARPHAFNMDASGLATDPDGKIHAIGDGSTKDGKLVESPVKDPAPTTTGPSKETLEARRRNNLGYDVSDAVVNEKGNREDGTLFRTHEERDKLLASDDRARVKLSKREAPAPKAPPGKGETVSTEIKDNTTPLYRTVRGAARSVVGGTLSAINAISSPFISDAESAGNRKRQQDAKTAIAASDAIESANRDRDVARASGSPTKTPDNGTAATLAQPSGTPVRSDRTGSRAAEIAAANGDVTKMPTDNRMDFKGDTNAGGAETIVKSPTQTPTQTPVGPPAPPAPPAPARTYDFESGEGKELTGIVNGRKTYTKASELYGPAKPSIPNTIANTPATADPTKPVMIQGQSIDQQRADHQARNQNVAAADRAMSSTTAISPIAQPSQNITRPAIPRGPASQPIQTSYKRNDPTVDQGAVDKYLSAVKDSHNYGGTDEEYNRRKAAPEEISKASNEVTRLKMGGALALQGTAIDKPVIQKPVRPMLARR